MATATTTLRDFSSTLSRAWIILRRILWVAAGVFALLIVLEAIHLHRLLDGLHPALAWSVTGLLVAGLGLLLGRAVLRYLRLPTVLVPPDLPPVERGWDDAQRAAYRRFALQYLRRQASNPHLDEAARAGIPGALAAVGQSDDDLVEVVDREVAAVLEPLDRIARQMIRRAAVDVSVATAISPSILLDSLITLTRNVDLISKLADLYYGRPGLMGTLRIVRDVLGAAVTAGALEVISDNVTSAISEMTGSWSTRLLGPLGQGTVNGVVTMRLGAAARMRCRSLTTPRVPWRPWRLSDYRRGLSRLMDWLSEDVGPRVTRPLARWFARADSPPIDDTPSENDEPARGPRPRQRWWKRLLRVDGGGKASATRADEYEQPFDPLFDSDLFES